MDNKELITACLVTLKGIRSSTSSSITIRHIEILFYIYLHEGITRNELQSYLPEISETSLRRYIDQLGSAQWKQSYKAAQGIKLNLIREEVGEDLRYKHIYLNHDGREMICSVINKMLDGFAASDVFNKIKSDLQH